MLEHDVCSCKHTKAFSSRTYILSVLYILCYCVSIFVGLYKCKLEHFQSCLCMKDHDHVRSCKISSHTKHTNI